MSQHRPPTVESIIDAIPAMRGMSADALTVLIELLESAIETAQNERRTSCTAEGHKWDHANGKLVKTSDAYTIDVCTEKPRDLGDYGVWEKQTVDASYGLQRKCTRCGLVETGEYKSEVIERRQWTEWK